MSEPKNPLVDSVTEDLQEGSQSKKAAKKEAAKLEKQRRREQHASSASSALAGVSLDAPDPLAANYGDVPLEDFQLKAVIGRKWTEIGSLKEDLKDQSVLIRGRVHTLRAVSKKITFLVVREGGFTVQCVLTAAADLVSGQMVKFATSLSKESFVDVEGIV